MARNQKNDNDSVNGNVQETFTEDQTPPTRLKKIELDRNELVLCKNITHGKVIYVSKKTGAEYIWNEYGAVEYLDVGELLTMKASYPRILTEPWLIIEDEEVAKHLGLDKIYANILPVESIEEFFTWNVEAIEETIKKAPNGTKQLIGQKAREIREDLTVGKIRLLERLLDVSLDV